MTPRKEAKPSANGRPQISQITPPAAIPGGEFQIRGKSMARAGVTEVTIGEVRTPVVIGSNSHVVVRVPEGASPGQLVVRCDDQSSAAWACDVGVPVADNLHPVANPAVDRLGNVYAGFSGARGQKTPVSVYKIGLDYTVTPFLSDVMNATGLTFGRDGMLYVSSRNDGIVYQAAPDGTTSVYVEGMGVATGIAFDDDENLYVGDRSGTIFKISPSRQVYVFATLEPSIAAYHLAFGPEGYLYVAGPTTSSFEVIHRISHAGEVEVFYRGLGRPQGMAFDAEGNLYAAASLAGRRGVVRIDAARSAELFVSGPGIVGLAFTPSQAIVVATNNSLYRVDAGIQGRSVF